MLVICDARKVHITVCVCLCVLLEVLGLVAGKVSDFFFFLSLLIFCKRFVYCNADIDPKRTVH